jgi:hypothetical protein
MRIAILILAWGEALGEGEESHETDRHRAAVAPERRRRFFRTTCAR